MLSKSKIRELKKLAVEIRIGAIKSIGNLGFGHIGGVMSTVETLSVLYGEVMKYDPKNPKWKDRDWFICSKGHAGPAVYSVLAIKGFFKKEELFTLNRPETKLPSHCDENLTPGVDITTGSLGQGASLAVGVALGNKLDKRENYTYLMLGDGEIQEGQVWEAALYAAHEKLGNLITFVDYNKKQLDGYVKDINNLGDIKYKFEAFGWHDQEVDGHDVNQIYESIMKAKEISNKPSVIILNTIKGKGIPFAEAALKNHHIKINKEQLEESLDSLQRELKRLV